jgi:hypothetical protein
MPGLIRGVARTAVVAGTASAVAGRVNRHQQQKWASQDQQQYYEQQQAYQQQAPAAPAAPAAPPPAADGMEDKMTLLKQLGELHDSGVLTDAEFEAQKAKILSS